MIRGLFVTATGTGAGKTTITVALARAWRAAGREVVALKPIETGVESHPIDATELAAASGRPELANDPAWYRARLAASPHAASLEGEPRVELEPMQARIRQLARGKVVLVEGAGGLLVPLNETSSIADLACLLALPLLLVAPDRLGVLSDVLVTAEAAERRGLTLAAVVLNRVDLVGDESQRTNARILRDRLSCPIAIVESSGPPPAELLRLDPMA